MKVADSRAGAVMGSLIERKAVENIEVHVADAVDEAANFLSGWTVAPAPNCGFRSTR